MYFKQFYLGCLAHASYLIGSEDKAVVVDPQRDVEQYLNEAAAHGFEITHVIETHLHADFVSGHRELAERTGAQIIFGNAAHATIPHRAVRDGDEIQVGKVKVRVLETPGHTPESICLLITDAEVSDVPQKILTGDTLFIGDVGRPDLAGGVGYTPQTMAGMMFDSLHGKLLTLADQVEVFPAHGAGSMCGRNLSNDTSSTIGAQRKFNYALQPMSKEQFVELMTNDLPEAPVYFPRDAEINRAGAAPIRNLAAPVPLSPQDVFDLKSASVVLDVRPASEFGSAHVPGSLNIGLAGQFAIWAGCLIPLESPVIIVAQSDEEVAEAIIRLARVGIENVQGFLSGGIKAWTSAGYKVATVEQITVEQLQCLLEADSSNIQVVDVRRTPEYANGHVPRAQHAPLSSLTKDVPQLNLPPQKRTAVICAGGYRSSAATSILRQMGFENLLNVTGGTGAWMKAGYEVEK
jgi:hydroxyacylglutathione hydrolase